MTGNNVSHSKVHTKRRFLPNLHATHLAIKGKGSEGPGLYPMPPDSSQGGQKLAFGVEFSVRSPRERRLEARMIRARGLLFGGACFATLAGFTVAVSSTALPGSVTAHPAGQSGAAGGAVAGAVAAAASRFQVVVAGRAGTSAFVMVPSASAFLSRHSSANVPLIPTQTVTGVSPNAGASGAGGEQAVVITGSGFTGATDVFFGSGTDVSSTAYPCLSSPVGCFTVVSDTEIDADTPVETAGTVDVTVDAGTVNAPQDQYSYFDPPAVTNVASPQPQGATGVAVTGTNFSYPGVTPFASGVGAVDLVPTGGGSTVALTAVCSSGGQANCFKATTDTDLTINLPNSMASGQYDTRVTTTGGTSSTSSNDLLNVLPPSPTLTSLNPSSGAAGGGNNVILTGINFTGATDVNFGPVDISTVCGSGICFSIDSDTQITVQNVPAHAAGGVPVTVTTPGGTTGSKTYTYVAAAPTLSSVAPASGSTLGGNNVVLAGTNFTGATDVNFGPVDISTVCGSGTCFSIDSDTQITVRNVPAHAAGGVPVTVTTPGGTSASKTYTYATPPPTLTNLNPTSGSTLGGNDVVLTGTNFTGATDVNFGPADITNICGSGTCFSIDTSTQITVSNVPAHAAGGVSVNVTTPGGTTGSKTYTYVTPSPTLTNLSPSSGSTPGGNTVTLTGTNLTGATDVNFGPTDITNICGTGTCFTVDSSTQIMVHSIPGHVAGGVNVNVTTPGGTTNDLTYTYATPPPTLTTINPTSGSTAGGNSVVLTGTNLAGATDVHVGSSDLTACPSAPCFTIDSDTQITVTMPANIPGAVNVNVTTPGGTSAGIQYTYVAPAPTVTGVSPNEGAPAGGNTVALTGTGFEAAGTPITSQVTVGSAAPIITKPCGVSPTAPCFTVNSATSITIGFMPGGSGQVFITVTTPGGTSSTGSSNTYTYDASLPTVTQLLPKDGATGGREAVSLFGSGFGLAGQDFVSDVFFGTNDVTVSPCPPSPTSPCFTVVGPTQLSIYTPANTAGTVDVTVKTPPGTSGTGAADKYTFVAPGAYTALPPFRICDTRPAGPGIASNQCDTGSNRTLGTNGVVTAQISSAGGPVPLGAQAVVVNVTAINHSTSATFVTAYPAGGSRPLASNINLAGRTVEANLAIVQLSSLGKITLFNAVGSTDVIVDVQGYFAAPGGSHAGEFHSIPPLRICDSRGINHTLCAGASSAPLQGGRWRDVVVSGLPPGRPGGDAFDSVHPRDSRGGGLQPHRGRRNPGNLPLGRPCGGESCVPHTRAVLLQPEPRGRDRAAEPGDVEPRTESGHLPVQRPGQHQFHRRRQRLVRLRDRPGGRPVLLSTADPCLRHASQLGHPVRITHAIDAKLHQGDPDCGGDRGARRQPALSCSGGGGREPHRHRGNRVHVLHALPERCWEDGRVRSQSGGGSGDRQPRDRRHLDHSDQQRRPREPLQRGR